MFWKRLVEIFRSRLVRLSTSIRFRDSRGGGSDPTPPPPQAVVGTETAQAVAG